MHERTRSPSSGYHTGFTNATARMANEIGPRKTMFVLVVVVGCFAILWPKVFYPMLVGSANQHIKPSPIDKTTGCCDVFSETDMNTIKIMSELCSSIIQQSGEKPLTGKEIVARCKTEVQRTCGIDISAVLQEQIRLGRSVKQILNEVRSLNGSLCLKYHYGVAPWRLGVPHRITVNFTTNVRQERPPHVRPDIIHPAFRERGSAIQRPSGAPKKQVKIVEGRPGPIPGMRPTLGGAGHVVPPSQKGGSSMSVIMPIYTVGIVIFFTYTLMKLLFKKQPDGVGGSLYPPVDPDPRFRKEVFESERCKYTPRLSRDPTGRIGWKERDAIVNAMSALLDEVNGEIEARRRANLFVNQAAEREHPSVKILGMETTASCEGGQKWNKPVELVVPVPHPVPEPKSPPQEIYLQGALPAQSQLLVSDSAVVTEPGPDPAVVLAGKMTLSVISLDGPGENGGGNGDYPIPSIAVQTPEMVDQNGDSENLEDDPIEESKYTTASSATVAENEISEDEAIEEDIEEINDLEFETNPIDGVIANGIDLAEELPKDEEIEEEAVEERFEQIEKVDAEENDDGDRQKVEDVEILRREAEDLELEEEIIEGTKEGQNLHVEEKTAKDAIDVIKVETSKETVGKDQIVEKLPNEEEIEEKLLRKTEEKIEESAADLNEFEKEQELKPDEKLRRDDEMKEENRPDGRLEVKPEEELNKQETQIDAKTIEDELKEEKRSEKQQEVKSDEDTVEYRLKLEERREIESESPESTQVTPYKEKVEENLEQIERKREQVDVSQSLKSEEILRKENETTGNQLGGTESGIETKAQEKQTTDALKENLSNMSAKLEESQSSKSDEESIESQLRDATFEERPETVKQETRENLQNVQQSQLLESEKLHKTDLNEENRKVDSKAETTEQATPIETSKAGTTKDESRIKDSRNELDEEEVEIEEEEEEEEEEEIEGIEVEEEDYDEEGIEEIEIEVEEDDDEEQHQPAVTKKKN